MKRKQSIKKWLLNSSSIKVLIEFLSIMALIKVINIILFYFLERHMILGRYSYVIDVLSFLILTAGFTYFFLKSKEREEEIMLKNQVEMEKTMCTDYLTQVNNRFGLEKEINSILSSQINLNKNLTIIFLDLDDFKKVNDTYNHKIGDELLRAITKRIKNCIRETDIICRMGGDEFVIALLDIESKNDVYSVANKLIKTISLPYVINDTTIKISASIGCSTVRINESTDIDDVIDKADNVMYQAKKTGKNKCIFFD